MTAVPQRVLNWLYSVLTSGYIDVNRTYNDVAQALSHYSSLSPRTDVYTYENGASALLLVLSGTLPVSFRGTTYRFPIAVWVPHAYPREAPIVYVVPNDEMVVRAGQHVDPQGKVYHPYLVGWAEFWDKSNVLDFLAILRDVFAKEPPVVARQQQATSSMQQPVPPPRPYHPSSTIQSPPPFSSASNNDQVRPPPPPPKPGSRPSYTLVGPSRQDSRPPLPALPAQNSFDGNRYSSQVPRVSEEHFSAPSRSDSLRYDRGPPLPPQPPKQQNLRASPSPVSPITPPEEPYRRSTTQSHSMPQQIQQHQQQMNTTSNPHPPYNSQQMPPSYTQPPQIYQNQRPPQWEQYQQLPQPLPQQRKPPPPDLLSEPLTISLTPTTPPIAPPVPPNPEKDALLHTIASTLQHQRLAASSQINSTLPGLHGQHRALLASLSALETETRALESLSTTIESNTSILHSAHQSADQLIKDSKNWKEPHIDELLVAPTVVGNQLYGLVTEERALGDAIFILGRAKERGRVETGVFVRQTRSLAREWFLKKVLVGKIAKGMGLNA